MYFMKSVVLPFTCIWIDKKVQHWQHLKRKLFMYEKLYRHTLWILIYKYSNRGGKKSFDFVFMINETMFKNAFNTVDSFT